MSYYYKVQGSIYNASFKFIDGKPYICTEREEPSFENNSQLTFDEYFDKILDADIGKNEKFKYKDSFVSLKKNEENEFGITNDTKDTNVKFTFSDIPKLITKEEEEDKVVAGFGNEVEEDDNEEEEEKPLGFGNDVVEEEENTERPKVITPLLMEDFVEKRILIKVDKEKVNKAEGRISLPDNQVALSNAEQDKPYKYLIIVKFPEITEITEITDEITGEISEDFKQNITETINNISKEISEIGDVIDPEYNTAVGVPFIFLDNLDNLDEFKDGSEPNETLKEYFRFYDEQMKILITKNKMNIYLYFYKDDLYNLYNQANSEDE